MFRFDSSKECVECEECEEFEHFRGKMNKWGNWFGLDSTLPTKIDKLLELFSIQRQAPVYPLQKPSKQVEH